MTQPVTQRDRPVSAAEHPGGPRGPRPPGSRMPAVIQTALWMRSPYRSLEAWQRSYGRVFRVGIVGIPGFVYVSDPDLARRVFATDRDIGRAGAARTDMLESLVGPSSLLCLDGDEWTRQRKLLGSAFHGKRIERYRDEIVQIAREHVEVWPTGEPLALRPRMQAVTLEVMLRVVFGVRDAERVERLKDLLPRLTAAAQNVSMASIAVSLPVWRRIESLLEHIPGTPPARFTALRRATDELLYDEIARRRDASDVAERIDILSVLLRGRDEDGVGLTDAELRDSLMTLLVAGHETTATALSWAFERLVRNPDALSRLRRAVSDGDDDYLEAVAKETLRTRPVVPDMPRVLTEPLDLGGYRIPAGWWVSPAAPLLHHSPEYFPEPDEFRPERFLTEGGADPHAWLPFGGGRRQCLGSQLALLEMKAVIPEVLARLDIDMPDDPRSEAPRANGVTVTPRRGGAVTATAR